MAALILTFSICRPYLRNVEVNFVNSNPSGVRMSPHLIAIVVLAGIFLLGTVRSVNLGLLALVAAFGVGSWVFGVDTAQVLAGFPANLFVILVGVTYLFAIAKRNGTVDWLIQASVRAVGGHVAALPWVMFVLSGTLVALGALSPAAVAIIAPIGMAFAARYGINPLLMGLMVIHGSAAGNFSPLGVLGVITNGIVDGSDLPGSPTAIFLANLVFNLALAVVVYVAFGGLRLLRAGDRCHDHEPTGDSPEAVGGTAGGSAVAVQTRAPEVTSPTRQAQGERIATVVGMGVLAVGSLVFDLDIGLTAMTVASVLAVLSPATAKAATADVSWGVVLLISGIVTYVGLLEAMGTVDYIGDAIAAVPSPLLAALVLLFVGAVVSAFASTTGILGALIPLAVPLLALGDLGAVALVAALSISASVVDTSPFSTNGALAVANAPDGQEARVYRGLMAWGFGLVLVAPLVTWAVLVLPGW
jgi:di/tricarboxylate transporter